ncbi:MAG TPA: PAC2 family protein, partial [Gaiellaceae bacterium]|nr:PAC2 family protein [Gaiellaceae bacterium]
MASELRIHERPGTLERPILIGAFRGWNDGGQAATLAAGYLARLWGAHKFADIDPELFVDFQATRPMVTLEGGRTRKIEWPENVFYRARIPDANRDAVILVGVEPNYRWRTFSELVTELAAELRVALAVTLGA